MLGESVIAWAVVGAIGGWLGRAVVKTHGRSGLGVDLLVGVLGGLLSGWIFVWFGHVGFAELPAGSIIVAFIGSLVLLLVLRLFTGKKTA
jgi:uncharacterized membrane protein YeaQ/YmgE (transglycosylase-associated protein family)